MRQSLFLKMWMEHPDLDAAEIAVLACLLSHCRNGSNECFPSYGRIGALLKRSKAWVSPIINALEEKGAISVSTARNGKKSYILNDLNSTVQPAEPVQSTEQSVRPAEQPRDLAIKSTTYEPTVEQWYEIARDFPDVDHKSELRKFGYFNRQKGVTYIAGDPIHAAFLKWLVNARRGGLPVVPKSVEKLDKSGAALLAVVGKRNHSPKG